MLITRSATRVFLLGIAFVICAPLAAQGTHATVPQPASFDLLIRNARVVDGMGDPWYRADIGISRGRISEIGVLTGRTGTRTIDAQDRVVAPGFIDMMAGTSEPLIMDPASAESKLRQGITTMMIGEGDSEAPQNDRTIGGGLTVGGNKVKWNTFGEYFKLLEQHGIAVNVVHNVGAAQVRRVVIGEEDTRPTPAQMEQMKALVDQAMNDGAVGISTALIYPPGTYASTDELIELSKVAARHGGVYFSHMRNESFDVLAAIREALHIGASAGIPVHIYHLKAAGQDNWKLMPRAIALIDSACSTGLDVTADFYPYVRNGIGLNSFLHPRHFARGTDAFIATLGDAAVRRSLRHEVETTSDWENWYKHVGKNWNNVLITEVGPKVDSSFVGLSVAQVAQKRGVNVWTTFFDLVQQGGVGVAPESMNEEQKRDVLRAPWMSIDTDAPPTNPLTAPSAHPRAFGTFPRILAKYVREEHVVSIEDAVRKMSGEPASVLGLYDRGRIAPGMAADIVIFDPAKVQDLATFTKPLVQSVGIDYVIVNGQMAIDAGRATGAPAGKVLRHEQ
ncbi:MAG: N-acyl-D-amino-acid deacylase family protein [Gemmatimonadaceae bacterium]